MSISPPLGICRSCGYEGPLADFYKSSVNKTGFAYLCKRCDCARGKAARAANVEKNANIRGWIKEHPEITKKCGHCGRYLSIVEFPIRVCSADGLNGTCKTCSTITSRRHYAKHWGKYILNAARTRAKESGLEFDLTLDDLEIPDICPVLGIPLSIGGLGEKWNRTDGSPSIDRTNPALGYVKGNVKVISWLANCIKRDCYDPEIFEKIAIYIRRNQVASQ
jgi:hypothetical protein